MGGPWRAGGADRPPAVSRLLGRVRRASFPTGAENKGNDVGLKLVGAGLGRTGTHSLKIAIEQLIGGRCYHMIEVFGKADDVRLWQDALDGKPVDWTTVPPGYDATVDWPASAFWRELSAANPDAVVLLSTRSSADAWYKSASQTIFQVMDAPTPDDPVMRDHMAMIDDMFKGFCHDWRDEEAAKAAYEAHNAAVRAEVPADRLVDWQPGDGWEPIASALGMPVPSEPFPHVNTTDEFRAMTGLDS
jgi:hypothetical protein